jgi:predicted nucleic acid-binding protein
VTRVLLDSDVILDVFLQRDPFQAGSSRVLNRVSRGEIEAFIAAHTVLNVVYVAGRDLGRQEALRRMRRLLERAKVAEVNDSIVRSAMGSPISDFEDAVAHAAAVQAGARLIVTRNFRDFKLGILPVATPDMFLTDLDDESSN